MTTQHTPGPWHVGQGNGEGSIFADSGRVRWESGGTTLYPIATMTRGWATDEDDANARLISAAPALLAALRAMLATVHDEERDDATVAAVAAARAAIATATGEARA